MSGFGVGTQPDDKAHANTEVHPEDLVKEIRNLAYGLPDQELARALMDELLATLTGMLQRFREAEAGYAHLTSAAMNSYQGPVPDRDGLGRRRAKPYGKES